jgi:hypothetical protein
MMPLASFVEDARAMLLISHEYLKTVAPAFFMRLQVRKKKLGSPSAIIPQSLSYCRHFSFSFVVYVSFN